MFSLYTRLCCSQTCSARIRAPATATATAALATPIDGTTASRSRPGPLLCRVISSILERYGSVPTLLRRRWIVNSVAPADQFDLNCAFLSILARVRCRVIRKMSWAQPSMRRPRPPHRRIRIPVRPEILWRRTRRISIKS